MPSLLTVWMKPRTFIFCSNY